MSGSLTMNQAYSLCGENAITAGIKFSALYTYHGLGKKQVSSVEAGDIVAIAGMESVTHRRHGVCRGESGPPAPDQYRRAHRFHDLLRQQRALCRTRREIPHVAPPPGRLERENFRNVALKLKPLERKDAFEVCGRGELQMAVLIETMRREGYEFMVSKPSVITKKEDGKTLEPVEHVFIDVPEEFVGIVTEKLSNRKGRMVNLINKGSGRVNLEFIVPSRGLIGFRSHFMTDTKGGGVMNTLFEGYEPWFGPIPQRASGALLADRTGRVTTYASLAMVDRGELFVEVGTEVYNGMIIGERNRSHDMAVNITKDKKLTNMRSSTSEATVTLRPPRPLSLDQSIEFIGEDELVEVTPQSIRLRKMELDPVKRAQRRKEENNF